MGIIKNDRYFMRHALAYAKCAAQLDEVPVGAVIVKNNNIIASGFNQSITQCDPSAHAEIKTIRQAAHVLNNYRLLDTTLYVTVEPCLMCVGAIIHARITRVVYGCLQPKTGAHKSQCAPLDMTIFNHRIQWQEGILAKEASVLLKTFFAQKRKLKKTLVS